MVRRVLSVLGSGLLLLCCSCGPEEQAPPDPVPTYPTSFRVPDPEFDAETTGSGFQHAPDVDLLGISANVGRDGLRATFRYARDWHPTARARWGIGFELIGSDGSRISGAWTHDPEEPEQIPEVRLAPRPAGCAPRVGLALRARTLVLHLPPACLPAPGRGAARPWVRFDTLESVVSWHHRGQILYGWDQLYARVVAPEPPRLYLPH